MIRDLVGYGGDWPDFRWPNGSRLAVSVVINFEEGAKRQVPEGDAENEKIGEVISVVPEGRPDSGLAQIFAYGTRAGAWRMKEALKRHGIPATLFVCGRAAERAAPVLSALVADGHEAACHGWLWRAHADYDSNEEEAADFDRAAAAIRVAAGKRRRGFSAEAPIAPGRATFWLSGAAPIPRMPSTTTCPTAILRGLSSCPTHPTPTT